MHIFNTLSGLFIRHGYWLDLETTTWYKKAAPPFYQTTNNPNNMFTFRGLPTIFGSPTCNDNGYCANDRVIQYDPVTDKWNYLEDMGTARLYHEVIEVPKSFCYEYTPPPTEATTETTTEATTTGTGSTDEPTTGTGPTNEPTTRPTTEPTTEATTTTDETTTEPTTTTTTEKPSDGGANAVTIPVGLLALLLSVYMALV